jgi:ABC-type nitrate/sulfonate/bicarbonate transport system substrate-binding protein
LARIGSSAVSEKGIKGLGRNAQHRRVGHLGLKPCFPVADIAASGESPIARAAIGGKPVAVLANLCNIDEAILIIARKDRGIAVPADLRGKKIGVVSTTAAHFFLDTYLATSFIDPKEVHVYIGR